MPIMILLAYIVTLALAMTYAIGGIGLGLAIVIGLGLMVASELLQIRHDERERAQTTPGHHHNAHGGQR